MAEIRFNWQGKTVRLTETELLNEPESAAAKLGLDPYSAQWGEWVWDVLGLLDDLDRLIGKGSSKQASNSVRYTFNGMEV